MRYLLSVLLVVPFMMAMSSCSGDDKDDELKVDQAADLYGLWSLPTIDIDGWHIDFLRLEFKIDGILEASGKPSIGAGEGVWGMSVRRIKYKYEVTSNTIKLYKMDNTTKNPDTILLYKVAGDKLFLEWKEGENPEFLSIFTEKTVTCTRK